MTQQRKNGLANDCGRILPIFMLLIEFMTACSQLSVVTKTAQPTSQTISNEPIFTVVEVPPSFPGGNAQLSSYLRTNVRYPEAARKAKVDGRVFVSFIVTKEGHLEDVTILKGYGYGLDEEALRLVQTMPTWVPGRQANRPVSVKFNLVVPFDLTSSK
ncbi:energy transducer TonB [Spirosoma agri]|uniref:Energy transducer TonB n=1 Tax=Spirosoma agri TaxID=1987381 RepID=A0A6M0IT64_9BACT|nr:energy transducer TonB [Spirosoma agri]NEU70353.1 energy transducer TonB [Spirosoma agri]